MDLSHTKMVSLSSFPETKAETVNLINTETKQRQNGPYFDKLTIGKIWLGHVVWNGSPYLGKLLVKVSNGKIFFRKYTNNWKIVEEHEYNEETMTWHQNEIN